MNTLVQYNRIKEILTEKHLSTYWLADKLGIDATTISKWNTNKSQPKLDTLIKVANILEVDITALVNMDLLLHSNIKETTDTNIEMSNISNTHKPYRGIDLFCGIGGFRLAMDENNVDCVFSSDIDKFAQMTYKANFGEIPQGDITKIQSKNIPAFDILTAGFPCQPFSYAGEKAGFEDKTRGTLFFDICRILKYHKPAMVFLENVKGLVSHKNGETLKTILDNLRELGYFPHWRVLSSLDFGLPQKRERWYCVAFRMDIPFEFPKPLGGNPTLRDIVDLSENNPSLRLTDFEIDRIKYHFATVKSAEDRVLHDNSRYKPNTKKGKYGVYSFQKSDGSLRFHVGDKAKTQIQEAFYACLDTYAPTIIANRTPKLWDLQRRLSVLEAKRLQGFSDDFIMPVSDAQAYKQLGNSISVPIVKLIMKAMIQAYEKYK